MIITKVKLPCPTYLSAVGSAAPSPGWTETAAAARLTGTETTGAPETVSAEKSSRDGDSKDTEKLQITFTIVQWFSSCLDNGSVNEWMIKSEWVNFKTIVELRHFAICLNELAKWKTVNITGKHQAKPCKSHCSTQKRFVLMRYWNCTGPNCTDLAWQLWFSICHSSSSFGN